ncbi:glutathione S-transferase-like protein [Infundibulicybe gibba]|nr:glutathione S-transferase-like protein [Infundibulicybe gibba]
MVLKLYGASYQAGATSVVAVVLHEKKVPFEFVPIDMHNGGQKSAENLARNPFGKVPSIDDDGFILYESRAICRYIAIKYAGQGTPLIPPTDDIKATALFEQAASVEAFTFTPKHDAHQLPYVRVERRYHGLTPDQAKVDEHVALLAEKLEVYDQILGRQKYLAGDEVTLVDLFHLGMGGALALCGTDVMTRRPNVARWYNDLTSREAWQALNDGVKSRA